MKKTLLIDSIITPYIVPRYNAIQEKIDGNFTVWFQSFTDVNRKWTNFPETYFQYDFLKDKPIRLVGKDISTFHINYEFPKKLQELNPDHIIICGWDSFASLYAVLWARKNKKKLTLWAGSTKYETSWRRTLTLPYVKWIIRNCTDFISYGTRATEYFVSLGANKAKIQSFYNTVDIDFFSQNAEKLRPQKEEIKKKYDIKTKYVLLFVGQLIKRKGIYEILNGFAEFQKTHPDISLVFAGSGQEQENMEKIIQEQDIKNAFFPGFFQNDTISELYAMADIFTLPSQEEVWGLVINEAMCFGLPIITAYQVGASVDLVQEGKNGYVMRENSAREFLNGLECIFEKGLVEKNNSVEIIGKFRVEDIVKGVKF